MNSCPAPPSPTCHPAKIPQRLPTHTHPHATTTGTRSYWTNGNNCTTEKTPPPLSRGECDTSRTGRFSSWPPRWRRKSRLVSRWRPVILPHRTSYCARIEKRTDAIRTACGSAWPYRRDPSFRCSCWRFIHSIWRWPRTGSYSREMTIATRRYRPGDDSNNVEEWCSCRWRATRRPID